MSTQEIQPLTITSNIPEEIQKGSFQNSTLQSVGNDIAVSIATYVCVPEHIVAKGQGAIVSFLQGELRRACLFSQALSFNVQIGKARDHLDEIPKTSEQTFEEVEQIVLRLSPSEYIQTSFPYIDFRTDWINLTPSLPEGETSYAEALVTLKVETNKKAVVEYSLGTNTPKNAWTDTLPDSEHQAQLKVFIDALILKLRTAGIDIDSITQTEPKSQKESA